MSARAKEFASLRLSGRLRERVNKMARTERRSLSQMLRILVEEAMDRRDGTFSEKLEAEIASNLGLKLRTPSEAEGLR